MNRPDITLRKNGMQYDLLRGKEIVAFALTQFEAHTLRLQMEIAADVAAIRGMMEERR